jgi:hypothetical protein
MKHLEMRSFVIAFVTHVGIVATLVGCRDHSQAEPAPPATAEAPAIASASAAPSASGPPPATSTIRVNVLPIPTAAVANAVNPARLPVYDGPTGAVDGTVTIDGDPAPDVAPQDYSKCPAGAKAYQKLFRAGAAGANGKRPLADALVGVEGYAGFVPETHDALPVSIDQCAFSPRTMALTYGQRLEVTNNTSAVIAPSLDRAPTPALMIAPPRANGDAVKLYPPHPGYYTLEDKMGGLPFLKGDVYVLLFPFHASTTADGHFHIDGIPVGHAKVFTRLRSIGKETALDVEITAGGTTHVDLSLHYSQKEAAALNASRADAGARVIP